jgi:hypothetical protein
MLALGSGSPAACSSQMMANLAGVSTASNMVGEPSRTRCVRGATAIFPDAMSRPANSEITFLASEEHLLGTGPPTGRDNTCRIFMLRETVAA